MNKKKKIIPIFIMLLLCFKLNHVVLGAKGSRGFHYHSSGTGDGSLMSTLWTLGTAAIIYCIQYGIHYNDVKRKLYLSLKRLSFVLVIGVVIGLGLFIFSDNQRGIWLILNYIMLDFII